MVKQNAYNNSEKSVIYTLLSTTYGIYTAS